MVVLVVVFWIADVMAVSETKAGAMEREGGRELSVNKQTNRSLSIHLSVAMTPTISLFTNTKGYKRQPTFSLAPDG